MERKQKPAKLVAKPRILNEQKPTWKKITEGKLYPFPRNMDICIKQNETIQATVKELGNKIDHFQLVKPGSGEFAEDTGSIQVTETGNDNSNSITITEPSQDGKETYTVTPVDGGLYQVVSSTGAVMNTDNLELADAEALKASLEAE